MRSFDVEGSGMSWVVEHNYNGLVFKNRSDSALVGLQQLEKIERTLITWGRMVEQNMRQHSLRIRQQIQFYRFIN